MNWSVPQVTESINRLTYCWDELELLVYADRITDAGQAELWFYHRNDEGDKLLNIAKVNLLASSTMSQLAKRMITHSEDYPWQQIMTYISKTTLEYQRKGEPSVILNSSTLNKPQFFVEPIILKDVPNIIFGDKGAFKTTLGIALLGLISSQYKESPLNLQPSLSANIAMLDWEGTTDLTSYTLTRLVNGSTIPRFTLPYLRCKQPLAEDIHRISLFLEEHRTNLLLIDSLGQAAGSDKFDSAGKASALQFFEALRQLNITSLIIAQNAKDESKKKTIYGSTYFTYYARNILELQAKEGTSPDRLHLALFHREGNYTKKYAPLAWCATFTDDTILLESEPVNLSEFLETASLTKKILECLEDTAKSASKIGIELSLPDTRIRVRLSQLKKRGLVTDIGSGLWRKTEIE